MTSMPHADSCECKRSAKRSRADSRIGAPVGRVDTAIRPRALRAPFAIAIVRMRHRCHALSRDATSPESLRLVGSIETFPGAFLKVASKADRTRYCTELNSLLPRAGVRDEKEDVPGRQNRSRLRLRCIRS